MIAPVDPLTAMIDPLRVGMQPALSPGGQPPVSRRMFR